MTDYNTEMDNVESDSLKLAKSELVTASELFVLEHFAREVKGVLLNTQKAVRQMAMYSFAISDAYRLGQYREAYNLLMLIRPLFAAYDIKPEAFTND